MKIQTLYHEFVCCECPAILEHYYNIKNIQYCTRKVVNLDVPSSQTGCGERSLQ